MLLLAANTISGKSSSMAHQLASATNPQSRFLTMARLGSY